jgi:molecular chaperone DnaK
MVDDAKSHESEDQRRRAEIETRNQADTLVYSTEKMMRDNADKIPEELKTRVEAKITTLKSAIEANNVAEMQTSMTDLNQLVQEMGQAVYAQASAAGSTDGVGDEPPSADEEQGGSTVEGEFREV